MAALLTCDFRGTSTRHRFISLWLIQCGRLRAIRARFDMFSAVLGKKNIDILPCQANQSGCGRRLSRHPLFLAAYRVRIIQTKCLFIFMLIIWNRLRMFLNKTEMRWNPRHALSVLPFLITWSSGIPGTESFTRPLSLIRSVSCASCLWWSIPKTLNKPNSSSATVSFVCLSADVSTCWGKGIWIMKFVSCKPGVTLS